MDAFSEYESANNLQNQSKCLWASLPSISFYDLKANDMRRLLRSYSKNPEWSWMLSPWSLVNDIPLGDFWECTSHFINLKFHTTVG